MYLTNPGDEKSRPLQVLDFDVFTNGHTQWFYFAVRRCFARLFDFSHGGRHFEHGMHRSTDLVELCTIQLCTIHVCSIFEEIWCKTSYHTVLKSKEIGTRSELGRSEAPRRVAACGSAS